MFLCLFLEIPLFYKPVNERRAIARALLRSYKPEKPVFCALPLRAKNLENVFWRACVPRLNNLEARF